MGINIFECRIGQLEIGISTSQSNVVNVIDNVQIQGNLIEGPFYHYPDAQNVSVSNNIFTSNFPLLL